MTKHLHKLGFLLVAGLGLGSMSASAQTIYEPFEGTGAMNGYNGWAMHSGTAGQLMRADGNLTYQGLKAPVGNKLVLKATDSEDINKIFDAPVTSGAVYGSVLLNVTDVASISPNTSEGNYFIHFQTARGNTPFVARVYIRAGSQPNTINIGILNNSPVPAAPFSAMYGDNPVNYPAAQTHLIVFKYDIATNTSSLWVNPSTLGGTEPTAQLTHTGGTANESVSGVAIRQSLSNGLNTGNIEIDEVRAGATYAAVTPPTVSGVKDFAAANIGLFPNPTAGAVKLQLPASLANGEVGLTVYSSEGKAVLQATGTEQSLNEQLSSKMAAAANGVYIVKIEANGQSFQTRIVKN